jgi:hypothetical protein
MAKIVKDGKGMNGARIFTTQANLDSCVWSMSEAGMQVEGLFESMLSESFGT